MWNIPHSNDRSRNGPIRRKDRNPIPSVKIDILVELGIGDGGPFYDLGCLIVHDRYPECGPRGVQLSTGLENGEVRLKGRGRHPELVGLRKGELPKGEAKALDSVPS